MTNVVITYIVTTEMSKLKDEIGKQSDFESQELEAFLNLLRTSSQLMAEVEELLRPAGISGTQYNVLRILRGMGATDTQNGVPCGEVAQRMVTRDPDITRLLDRMERAGLIVRARSRQDRRVVKTAITAEGLKVLKKLDQVIVELHERQLKHLGERKLKVLIGLLEEVREAHRRINHDQHN